MGLDRVGSAHSDPDRDLHRPRSDRHRRVDRWVPPSRRREGRQPGPGLPDGSWYFWRLLSFRLLLLLFGIILAALAFAAAIGSLGICIIPLLCIGIPLAFLGSVYVSLAQVALIDDDKRTLDGFRRGWEVLRGIPARRC